ncbi:MAG TPA: hypothetical protein VIK75_00760, partial [Calditerricola sp.]
MVWPLVVLIGIPVVPWFVAAGLGHPLWDSMDWPVAIGTLIGIWTPPAFMAAASILRIRLGDEHPAWDRHVIDLYLLSTTLGTIAAMCVIYKAANYEVALIELLVASGLCLALQL